MDVMYHQVWDSLQLPTYLYVPFWRSLDTYPVFLSGGLYSVLPYSTYVQSTEYTEVKPVSRPLA